jgi:hypothetical protein
MPEAKDRLSARMRSAPCLILLEIPFNPYRTAVNLEIFTLRTVRTVDQTCEVAEFAHLME